MRHHLLNYLEFGIRMESVSFKRTSSVAKMLGTVVSIGGAFIVTLYNGPVVISMSPPSVSLRSLSTNHNWIIGAAFLSVEYFMVPLWYIVQVVTLINFICTYKRLILK